MGRGRQKAKHTKVARELKYFSPETNLGALEQELRGGTGAILAVDDGDDDDYDPHAPDDVDDPDPRLAVWQDLVG